MLPKCIQFYLPFAHDIRLQCLEFNSTEENIRKIEALQNKCLRILNLAEFNSPTNELYKDMELIKLRHIIDDHQLRLAYEFFVNKLSNDLLNLFTVANEIQSCGEPWSPILLV